MILRLVNNDGDTQTSVHIDSVQLVNVGQSQTDSPSSAPDPASITAPPASSLVLVAEPSVASSSAAGSASAASATASAGTSGQLQAETAATPQATLVGPVMNYKSRADSPFVNAGYYPFYLEDFETHSITVPGVTLGPPGAGLNSAVYGPDLHSSVDGDDGKIDGSGLAGDDIFSGSGVVTFTFDPKVLESLPTHAGLVWTDGSPDEFTTGNPGGITFEAFDGAGNLILDVGPVPTPPNHTDVTVDDAIFFGVNYAGGIGEIELSVNDSAIEVDHLQYGWDHAPPTITVSSPADGSNIAANTSVLVSGRATSDLPIGVVTVNNKPVDSLDSTGDFFTRVDVLPGQNTFTFTAYDAAGGTTSTTLALNGVEQPPGAVDYSLLSDVSASFQAQYARTSFDDDTNVLYADLAIQNTGQYDGDAPLLVGITHLSNPDVKVRDADGLTPDGMPYFDLSSLVTSGVLKPGGATGFRSISFYNPDRTPFTYDLVFLGELNQPPQITSVPVIQAIAGKPYAYAAAAVDPDGDTVTYSLMTAPAYLTIDSKTGLISGTPGTGDIGTQSVVLEADDGRGGTTQQRYVLSVIAPPPNQPPYFTSVPVDDGRVGAAYSYPATASDPDGDALTFSVLSGPKGLTIDPSSGSVTWTPSADQTGNDSVTLQVDDGNGGTAKQTFTIDVQPEAGNHPPVIISTPVTTAIAYQNGVSVPYTYLVQAVDPDGDPLTYSLTTAPGGMTINATTGQVTWQYVQSLGPNNVMVQVTDGRGGEDTQSYVLTVVNGQWGMLSGTVFNDQNGDGVQNGFISAIVPGTSDPWLAGMPDGSTASQEDVAPQESPVQVQGLTLTAGSTLSFSTFGSVDNIPDPSTSGPDGTVNGFTFHNPGVENGIADVFAPINSLVGIFLGPDQPSLSAAPPDLNFENVVPGGIDYTTLSPALKQVFFIGDGLTSKGQVQQIVVPAGATRFFLGTMDGYGWDNNWGSFFVNISQGGSIEPGLGGWTVYLDQNQDGAHDSGELSTTTDAGGKYTFGELPPGNYTVAEEGQPGWQQTGPAGGTYSVALAAGQMATGLDFGNTQQGVASGGLPPAFGGPPPFNRRQGRPGLPVSARRLPFRRCDLRPARKAGRHGGRPRHGRRRLAADPRRGRQQRRARAGHDPQRPVRALDAPAPRRAGRAAAGDHLHAAGAGPRRPAVPVPGAGPGRGRRPDHLRARSWAGWHDDRPDDRPPDLAGRIADLPWDRPERQSGRLLAARRDLGHHRPRRVPQSSRRDLQRERHPRRAGGYPPGSGHGGAVRKQHGRDHRAGFACPGPRPAHDRSLGQVRPGQFGRGPDEKLGGPQRRLRPRLLPVLWGDLVLRQQLSGAGSSCGDPTGPMDRRGRDLRRRRPEALHQREPRGFNPLQLPDRPIEPAPAHRLGAGLAHLDRLARRGRHLRHRPDRRPDRGSLPTGDAGGGRHGDRRAGRHDDPGLQLGGRGRPVERAAGHHVHAADDDPAGRHLPIPGAGIIAQRQPADLQPADRAGGHDGRCRWRHHLGRDPARRQRGHGAAVQDETGGFVTQDFTIGVVSQLSVQPPAIVSTPGLYATVGLPYAYDAHATDPQGAAITWSLISAPLGLSINPDLGTLRWTPTEDESGTQSVMVRAPRLAGRRGHAELHDHGDRHGHPAHDHVGPAPDGDRRHAVFLRRESQRHLR